MVFGGSCCFNGGNGCFECSMSVDVFFEGVFKGVKWKRV